MNFKIRFNLSENATEALIKFIKLILTEISNVESEDFVSSLYTVKNFLGLSDQFVKFVAYKKCHKLYKKYEVANFRQLKCAYVEFSNSTTRKRKVCNMSLCTQSRLLNGKIINKPELIFPFSTIW